MKRAHTDIEYIEVELVDERPCKIEEIAKNADMSVSTVRRYVELGLIKPVSTEKGCYFAEGVILSRIAKIRRMRSDLGINLCGISVILDLLDRIEDLNQQLLELKLRL